MRGRTDDVNIELHNAQIAHRRFDRGIGQRPPRARLVKEERRIPKRAQQRLRADSTRTPTSLPRPAYTG